MKDSFKRCYNCRYFKRFFTRGQKQFNKTDYGYCDKKTEIQISDKRESCEYFEIKVKPRIWYNFIKRYLNDLLTEITSIRAVMEEESSGEEDV